jgi:sodium/bile acid cotransporter 7
MAVAVFLAWRFPNPGAKGGFLHPEIVTKIGIALIFFLHGLSLSFEAFKSGAFRWKLHLVVQTATFLLFPALGELLLLVSGSSVTPDLQLGFFYLCVLPSTVSSSVALTAAARGNVPAAVFNATLSSLIGIFITPLWISWRLKSGGVPMPYGKVILDLVIWLLLPLILGQMGRPILGELAAQHKKGIHILDRLTILLLVYTSFCDSIKLGAWSTHGWKSLVITFVGSIIMFFLVMLFVSLTCQSLHFSAEDRIAAIFCGSKKTLASGVPMAQLIFGSTSALGLILLPIMIYHPLQLIICGALASKWAARD